MPAPAGPWSVSPIQQPLPHRAQKSRSAHVQRGTGNTAVPAPPGAAIQAAQHPEKVVRVVVALLALTFPPQPTHRPQKLFVRKRLHHVTVRALLLGPKLVTLSVLGTHHDHRNA